MIIADTNVWSELNKPRPDPKAMAWIAANEPGLWLSPIVIAEVRYGLERPEASHRREGLVKWLAGLEEIYRERTLLFDADDGHALGLLLLKKPQQAKLLDTLIAAQGLSRGCAVATRNAGDFAWTGVRVVNPWEG